MHPPNASTRSIRSPRGNASLLSPQPAPSSSRILHHLHNGTHQPFHKFAENDPNSKFPPHFQHQEQKDYSLLKHQHFGKKGQICGQIQVSSSHRPPLPAKAEQRRERAMREQKEGWGTGEGGCFKQHKIVQVERCSQYYQCPKTLILHTSPKNTSNIKHNLQKKKQTGLEKIQEVTFSMDSTQPEIEEKQTTNEYQLAQPKQKKQYTEEREESKGGRFLTAFRKSIIQKQIHQKEQKYRVFIRSWSRQGSQQEKARLKSKMKEVLDDLYQLKQMMRS